MRIPECECGWVFAVESDWNYKSDLSTEHLYMICVNPACSRHNVPYAIPRVALTPADPVAVAHVQEAERKK
jgi:hypothetical protein